MSNRSTDRAGATPVQESSRSWPNPHLLDTEEEVSGEGGSVEENGSEEDDDDDDDEVEPNSPALLKEGIIRTKENKKELTILLVGETGGGKTTMLSFIANVLKGSMVADYANVHDEGNEATGSEKGSKTNEPRLYIHTSKNDVVLRVLDTPGLADTRGLDHDNQHKENIAKAIRETITTVDAVLIIANGTLTRLTVATDYALSALSSMFPRTIAENIAFIFTNVLTRPSLNVKRDSLPEALRGADQFLFDNPMGLQKNHEADLEKQRQQIQDQQNRLEQELKPKRKEKQSKALDQLRAKHRNSENQFQEQLKRTEESALGTLVELFDWINKCETQPTKDILELYAQAQAIDRDIGSALAVMDDAAKEKEQLQQLKADIEAGKIKVGKLNNFETFVKSKRHVQVPQGHSSVLCYIPGCYSNCHERCTDRNLFPLDGLQCEIVGLGDCKICGHPTRHHQRCKVTWEEEEMTKRHVDTEKEKKYLAAKGELREKEAAKSKLQMRIDELTKEIDDAMSRITHTAEKYAKLSLSGSFSGQIEKSIQLLNLSIEAMQSNNPRKEVLDEMNKIVRDLERKLEILRGATGEKGVPTRSNVGNLVEGTSKNWVVPM